MGLTANGKLLQQRLDKQVGDPYIWGAEDCSELFYDVMGPEGFHAVKSRETADDYYHMGTRIGSPSQVGDYFILLTSGTNTAHHIGMFYGPDAHGVLHTVEARGKAYGTPKYRLDDPHNGVHARGGIWMRLKGAALGPVAVAATPAPAKPADHSHLTTTAATPLYAAATGTGTMKHSPVPKGVRTDVIPDATGATKTGERYHVRVNGPNGGIGWLHDADVKWG